MKLTALTALAAVTMIQFSTCGSVTAKSSKGEPTPTESFTPAEASADKSQDSAANSKLQKSTEKSTDKTAAKVAKEKTAKEKPLKEKPVKESKSRPEKSTQKIGKGPEKAKDKAATDTKAESTSKPDPERTPDAVLKRLQVGNLRYLNDRSIHSRFDAQRRMETAELGQKPFATVLGCSDARVPPEVVFDQGFADIFVIRVAGNVCGESELASAEYGTKYLGTQLLVVLGHSKCGAVDATLKGAELEGSLPKLVSMIEPAVESTKRKHPNLKDDDLLNQAIESNCRQTIDQLMKGSPVLRELVQSNKLKIVGAIRNIQTGKVQWIK